MKNLFVNNLKKNSTFLNRYVITSISKKSTIKTDADKLISYWCKAHDSLLDLNVIIYQFHDNICNIEELLPFISDSHNILDYTCINGCTYIISDNVSFPENEPFYYNRRFVITTCIVSFFLICIFLLISSKTSSTIDQKNNSLVSSDNNDTSSSTETPGLEIDPYKEYLYDDSRYYRIVMYPLNELTEYDFNNDYNIIKGRFDALCGNSKYELKKFDNHLCAFIPIDSVDGLDSLKYLCKYFISSRFEVSSLDVYKDSNTNRRYEISTLEPDDFKNISLNYGIPNEAFVRRYNSNINHDDEQNLQINDDCPYINIEFSNSLIHKMNVLLQNTEYSFSDLGIVTNGNEYRTFDLIENSDYSSVLFPSTIYTFSNNAYIENALNLLISDFKLGPLCSDYSYSITTNDILWDTELTTGINQCSINNFTTELCYIDYSVKNDLMSAGQFLDLKKYLCNVMDSLHIPYALGRKDNIKENCTHIYIACGYENMGLPIANMISQFSSSHNQLYLYDGFYKLPITNYRIDSSDNSISVYMSEDNSEIVHEYISYAKSQGHNELYLTSYDTLLVKTDLSRQNSLDCITFDELIYDSQDEACEWDFIKNLFDAPNNSQYISFNGIELIPLDKDMSLLANQFTVKPFYLDTNTIKAINSIVSDASVSYEETYDGNLYNILSGRININLNLNVDDNFPSISTECVKKITELCNINNNPQIELITYTLTKESLENLEKSKISIFRHYIPLENDFSLGELSSNSSFDELLSESKKEMGQRIPVDYANYYLINYSGDYGIQADAGIYSAALLLGKRMNSYKDTFHNIIINDSWFNYSDVFESLWIYEYEFPYEELY